MSRVTSLLKGEDVLIERVDFLTGLRRRMRGLLGAGSLPAGQAVCLVPCGSIHTFFMQFSLDVIFMDRTLQVTKILTNLPPGRIAWGGFRAHSVLEMQAGWFPAAALSAGDRIRFHDSPSS